MSWLRAIFGAIGAFFGWLDHKALMDAGKAMANAKQSKETLDNVAKANAAKRDPDVIERLRNDRFRD